MTPKLIHHIILGSSPTELIISCVQSWEKLKDHDFQIIIWSYEDIKELLNKYFQFALNAFLSSRNYGELTDIARYLIVYKFGGYYVDWDILLFNYPSFLELSESHSKGYLLIDKSNGVLSSEHFSAPPQENFLLSVVEDIVHSFNEGEMDLMATPEYTGPFRMTSTYKKFPVSKQTIIDIKAVYEYDYSEIRGATTYGKKNIMVHFWTHSWMNRGIL